MSTMIQSYVAKMQHWFCGLEFPAQLIIGLTVFAIAWSLHYTFSAPGRYRHFH